MGLAQQCTQAIKHDGAACGRPGWWACRQPNAASKALAEVDSPVGVEVHDHRILKQLHL